WQWQGNAETWYQKEQVWQRGGRQRCQRSEEKEEERMEMNQDAADEDAIAGNTAQPTADENHDLAFPSDGENMVQEDDESEEKEEEGIDAGPSSGASAPPTNDPSGRIQDGSTGKTATMDEDENDDLAFPSDGEYVVEEDEESEEEEVMEEGIDAGLSSRTTAAPGNDPSGRIQDGSTGKTATVDEDENDDLAFPSDGEYVVEEDEEMALLPPPTNDPSGRIQDGSTGQTATVDEDENDDLAFPSDGEHVVEEDEESEEEEVMEEGIDAGLSSRTTAAPGNDPSGRIQDGSTGKTATVDEDENDDLAFPSDGEHVVEEDEESEEEEVMEEGIDAGLSSRTTAAPGNGPSGNIQDGTARDTGAMDEDENDDLAFPSDGEYVVEEDEESEEEEEEGIGAAHGSLSTVVPGNNVFGNVQDADAFPVAGTLSDDEDDVLAFPPDGDKIVVEQEDHEDDEEHDEEHEEDEEGNSVAVAASTGNSQPPAPSSSFTRTFDFDLAQALDMVHAIDEGANCYNTDEEEDEEDEEDQLDEYMVYPP
ncbi:hypothetical protein FPV67DRAFT_1691988, partial [Lyophyllum atratum]